MTDWQCLINLALMYAMFRNVAFLNLLYLTDELQSKHKKMHRVLLDVAYLIGEQR